MNTNLPAPFDVIQIQLNKILDDIHHIRSCETSDIVAMSRLSPVRNILQLSRMWLWKTDDQLRFNYISPEFNELVGTSPEQFYGCTGIDILQDSNIFSLDVKQHRKALQNKVPFSNFSYLINILGIGERWFKVSGCPRYNDSGRFCGYWGVATDTTESKLAEIADSERMQELARAMDVLDVSVLILDSKHDISFHNARWRRLHEALSPEDYEIGVSYEHYLQKAIAYKLFPDAIGNEQEFIRNRIAKNLMPPNEPFQIRRQDGIQISITVSRFPNDSIAILSTNVTPK